jgi:hypothetical protein
MDDGLSVPVDNQRTLWLTEISRSTYESQDLHELGSDNGLFVVLEDCSEGTYDVLAKVVSIFAGQTLMEMMLRKLASDRGPVRVIPA